MREICRRCPLAMGEDLLSDLIQYKTHRDKGLGVRCLVAVLISLPGVIMAARSLIQLFREVNPELLHKKERVWTQFLRFSLLCLSGQARRGVRPRGQKARVWRDAHQQIRSGLRGGK